MSAPRSAGEHPRRCVLVVDDDEGIRDAMAEVLRDAGYEVAEAGNGREALAQLERCKPALILLDLMMPVMDGQQFRARQRRDRRFSDVPVVVITAGGDRSPQADMAVQGWLTKPVELDVLLGEVEEKARA